MRIFTIITVLVTLIDRLCLSEIRIKITERNKCTELEDAAIEILTTCYKNRGNTIPLYGDFSDNIVNKLSSRTSYGVVLLDDGKREDNHRRHGHVHASFDDKRLKFHFIVVIATTYQEIIHMLTRLHSFTHANSLASVFVLGWSAKSQCIPYTKATGSILSILNSNEMHNVNVLTGDLSNGIWIITSSPYGMVAPRPWLFIRGPGDSWYPALRYYLQKYQKDETMCKNLEFEKTKDVAALPMEVVMVYENLSMPSNSYEFVKDIAFDERGAELMKREFGFIKGFLKSINATVLYKLLYTLNDDTGAVVSDRGVTAIQANWRSFARKGWSCTYPEKKGCIFLITRFRGNKSQLEKMYGVIDGYSWIGMLIVNFITLIFFKYFLHQPFIIGLLNLVRLAGNWGLTRIPLNLAPRVYIACLLFFVVTMCGILTGDLAALLTHDIPVRQVNTIKDLADLNYTVYLHPENLMYFNDRVFKNRLRPFRGLNHCIDNVMSDPLAACVAVDDLIKSMAREIKLYVSSGCIDVEYACCPITPRWAFEKRLNRFLRIMIEAGTRMSLDSMVYHKRTLEAAAIEVPLEPKVMVFKDLQFAFNILGFGLVCASLTFLVEFLVGRYHRRRWISPVIVL